MMKVVGTAGGKSLLLRKELLTFVPALGLAGIWYGWQGIVLILASAIAVAWMARGDLMPAAPAIEEEPLDALTGLQPGAGSDAPIALPPDIDLPPKMAETMLPTDVVGLARGFDAVQVQIFERVAHDGADGGGDVAFAGVHLAGPVAERGCLRDAAANI